MDRCFLRGLQLQLRDVADEADLCVPHRDGPVRTASIILTTQAAAEDHWRATVANGVVETTVELKVVRDPDTVRRAVKNAHGLWVRPMDSSDGRMGLEWAPRDGNDDARGSYIQATISCSAKNVASTAPHVEREAARFAELATDELSQYNLGTIGVLHDDTIALLRAPHTGFVSPTSCSLFMADVKRLATQTTSTYLCLHPAVLSLCYDGKRAADAVRDMQPLCARSVWDRRDFGDAVHQALKDLSLPLTRPSPSGTVTTRLQGTEHGRQWQLALSIKDADLVTITHSFSLRGLDMRALNAVCTLLVSARAEAEALGMNAAANGVTLLPRAVPPSLEMVTRMHLSRGAVADILLAVTLSGNAFARILCGVDIIMSAVERAEDAEATLTLATRRASASTSTFRTTSLPVRHAMPDRGGPPGGGRDDGRPREGRAGGAAAGAGADEHKAAPDERPRAAAAGGAAHEHTLRRMHDTGPSWLCKACLRPGPGGERYACPRPECRYDLCGDCFNGEGPPARVKAFYRKQYEVMTRLVKGVPVDVATTVLPPPLNAFNKVAGMLAIPTVRVDLDAPEMLFLMRRLDDMWQPLMILRGSMATADKPAVLNLECHLTCIGDSKETSVAPQEVIETVVNSLNCSIPAGRVIFDRDSHAMYLSLNIESDSTSDSVFASFLEALLRPVSESIELIAKLATLLYTWDTQPAEVRAKFSGRHCTDTVRAPPVSTRARQLESMYAKVLIPYEHLQFERDGGVIGVGGFGKVVLARLYGMRVAVKFLDAPSDRSEQDIIDEIRAQSRLQHDHLVGLKGAARVPDAPRKWALVMELCASGDLEQALQAGNMSMSQCRSIAMQVLSALAYMHAERHIHFDIKPGNIMLTAYMQAKVGDFGLCRALDPLQTALAAAPGGTPVYAAPEVTSDTTDGVRSSADIYAIGWILWEMFCRQSVLSYVQRNFPPSAMLLFHINRAAARGMRPDIEFPPSVPVSWRRQLRDLISAAWATNPRDRPSAQECLERLSALPLQ